MALIKLENATVMYAVGSRGAFAVEEHVTLPDGRSFPKKYTVWYEGNTNTYKPGQIVEITGVLSAKIRDYVNDATGQPGRAIDMSINNPEVTVLHDVKAEPKDEGAPF